MIKEKITEHLKNKVSQREHEVIKLRWKLARLEQIKARYDRDKVHVEN